MSTFDYAIVGGGIVGLATAYSLQKKHPTCKVVIFEKEDSLAAHQTGNNSGVIHSGIYYKPGSHKAAMAKKGNLSMAQFCADNGINYDICGKVIIATDPAELPIMENLFNRGLQNDLEVKRLTPEEVNEIEPHVFSIGGVSVPSTGITSYKAVCSKLGQFIKEKDGAIHFETKVISSHTNSGEKIIETSKGTFQAKVLINCAGLHSDRVAKASGCDPNAKIVPFRGEYYELKPEKRYLVKHLIYPVPNPAFPFLGVHFTRMIDGNIHAGPNAVLSFKREGYRKTDFNPIDLAEVLTYGGFWKLASQFFGEGWKEMVRSFSKKVFVESLQRLIPEVTTDDVVPSHAGVRAQALLPDGKLVDDFLIIEEKNAFHVCNAPSPAATASLEIGDYIAEKIVSSMHVTVTKTITL